MGIVWIVAIVVFGILEALTSALVSIWFVFGGVAAFFATFFTDSILIQLTVFTAVSVVALIFTRPILKQRLSAKPVATNADRVIGQIGRVSQEIGPEPGGRVEVDGLSWSARCSVVLEAGCPCRVDAIEGATLVVSPIELKEESLCGFSS